MLGAAGKFLTSEVPRQTKGAPTGTNSNSTDQPLLHNEARALTDMLDHCFFFSDNSKETEPKLSPFWMIPAIERLCVIPDACTDRERQRTCSSGGASKNFPHDHIALGSVQEEPVDARH